MLDGSETDNQHHETLKALLCRGGAALTLAAISYARGDDGFFAGVLSLEIRAAARQVSEALAKNPAPAVLEQALQSALSPTPRTALPKWLSPVYQEPSCLSFIGRAFEPASLAAALGISRPAPSDREKGLAAAAAALCRLQDTLLTLSSRLPLQDGRMLKRMGRLAYVLAAPGEPSAVRGKIRKLLKGDVPWEG